MSNRPLDWEGIKTFTAIARFRSARAAAKSLRVHHSTVTRRVEQLEDAMQTRLFDRHPDGFVLTAEGERLLEVARSFENDLLDTTREIGASDTALTGQVRVTMAGPLAALVLAPKLHEFRTQYPAIEIELIASYDFLDIYRGEADIAVRADNNPPHGLVGKRLFPYFQAVYASHNYLAQHNLKDEPERACWIGWNKDDELDAPWREGTGFEQVPVWGTFPDLSVQLEAARAGLGIAMLPCIVGDTCPELIRASDHPPIVSRDMWLLTHRDLRATKRVSVVMDFIESLFRELEPVIRGDHPSTKHSI